MSKSLVAPLPSLAVLSIAGEDRTSWLQGQVTNDVLRGGTIHAFRLDSHGKIEAELLAKDDGARIVVLVDAGRAELVRASLDRRIVAEDVTVELAPDLVVVGGYGPAISGETTSLRSRRYGLEGFEWAVPAAERDALVARLAAAKDVEVVDEDALDRRRIELGRPRLGADFDACLPQETGLVGSTVSFVKGCYIGQEPVVMLEHRGKPPRRMFRIEGPDELVAPFDLTRDDGTVVGRVGSYRNGRGLALVKRADANPGGRLLAAGAAVTLVAPVDERADAASPPA